MLTGLQILAAYEKELVKYEKNRQELANAEKLFDLPITMYPELLQVQKEMKGLGQIYNIYSAQKVCTLVTHGALSITKERNFLIFKFIN